MDTLPLVNQATHHYLKKNITENEQDVTPASEGSRLTVWVGNKHVSIASKSDAVLRGSFSSLQNRKYDHSGVPLCTNVYEGRWGFLYPVP